MNQTALIRAIKYWLSDIANFSRIVLHKPLRKYQLQPARAILDSILYGKGLAFAVMMSRQAGKNELSGQLEAYLLNLYRRRGGGIVKASPTFKPQTINSILRLSDRLENPWNANQYRRREGYIVQLYKARAFFFSADPAANVVGATADILLEGDEAQDIGQQKWDTDFMPMGASTNVTSVLWGTAWTSTTMLAQQIAYLEQQQAKDGITRVFKVDADQVGQEVPAYARFVKNQVTRLGRQHPIIRTQYFLETIDGTGGLFDPRRRALMHGNHPRQLKPTAGHRYALLLDVAGEDENEGDEITRSMLANPKRDATALTVIDVILPSHPTNDTEQALYNVVDRRLWLGTKHTALHSQILALARHWNAVFIVVDATGIGAGLTSFLAKALGEKVIPFEFSSRTKSDLGWDFLASLRPDGYQEYANDEQPDTRQFWYETKTCKYEIRPGPGKFMKWGVWEHPAYDGLIAHGHDDLIISAALCAVLDAQEWPGIAVGHAVQAPDVLSEIDKAGWQ